MKKIILLLTILLTLAGTLLVPAPSVYAANADAPLRDLVTTNDNNQIIQYSGAGWAHTTDLTGYISEDRHESAVTSDYAQFKFYGVSVSLISAVDADQGKADIYIDTVFQETIDLYSATQILQSAIYAKTGLTSTTHTIKVVVKGEKNALSSGYVVNVDAFRLVDQPAAPPGGNEIECWTPVQHDPGYVCTQVNTQHITIVGTAVDTGHYEPPWHLLSAGVGTIYGKLTGTSVHWWSGPFSGSGTLQYRFDVKGEYCGQSGSCGSDQQTLNYSTYWPNGNQTVGVQSFTGEEVVAATGYYTTAAQSWPSGPAAGFTWRESFVLDLQTIPFANTCVDNYTVLETSGPWVIDPTIEHPDGPEQVHPVTPGQLYTLRVGGDGWHDGTSADQFGSQYSFDNETWYDTQAATCVSNTEGYYKYTAVIEPPDWAVNVHIRAKDDPGDFATNYMDANEHFVYTISQVIFTGQLTCDSQFTYDPETDWVATAEVAADEPYAEAINDPGEGPFIPGDWYAIQIASGDWQDGGVPPDRYDAQFSWGNVMTGDMTPSVPWRDIGTGGTGVFCEIEDGNYATIYVQAESQVGSEEASLWFRVNDEAETFDDNTGALWIDVYHTSFTRRPATCETTYGTQGFIGTTEIPANAENGVIIAVSSALTTASFGGMRLNPGAWYMLETTDGPWGWVGSTHSALSYDMQVMWGGDWVPLESWSASVCNIETDGLGHRRVYFQAPETGSAEYKFRVADTATWFNNIGSMSIELYGAYDMAVSLDDGSCDYQTGGQIGDAITVQATDADGEWIGFSLFADTVYAFKIEGSTSYWTEQSGGAHLYAMQISVDNGTEWADVPNGYAGILCYTQDGNDTWLFMQGGVGYMVRFRVDSESFSNNTGSMTVKVYEAASGDTINPWATCAEGLSLWVIDEYIEIDEKKEEGEYVPINDAYMADEDFAGFYIKIDWQSGPWYDGETQDQHYDAELSSDNGETWYPLDQTNPDITCFTWDFLRLFANAFFPVEEAQKWKIRVNDEDTATFTDNSGYLAYKLYVATEGAVPDCLVDTNNVDCIDWDEIPSGLLLNGTDVCTSSAIRPVPPASIVDVPAWLGWVGEWTSYGVQVMLQFLAWCPRHTDALMALFNVFKVKDPIAMMLEILEVVNRIKSELNAYNWGDTAAEATILTTAGSAGNASNSIINRLFPSNAGNPWSGGPVIVQTTWTGNARYDACVSDYGELLDNESLTAGMCFVSAAATMVGASFVLQIMLELAAVGLLLTTLLSEIRSLMNFMAGGSDQGSE
jgi:hypothetical protein